MVPSDRMGRCPENVTVFPIKEKFYKDRQPEELKVIQFLDPITFDQLSFLKSNDWKIMIKIQTFLDFFISILILKIK